MHCERVTPGFALTHELSRLFTLLFVADAGTIEAFGAPLASGSPKAAIAAGLGMVHQHFTLAENLTVLDNITIGTASLWSFKPNTAAARARLHRLANTFGLALDPER